jgi:hypothetical protein
MEIFLLETWRFPQRLLLGLWIFFIRDYGENYYFIKKFKIFFQTSGDTISKIL